MPTRAMWPGITSLRIANEDVEAAKALSQKTGVPYQTLLKQIIHEGLQRAL